MSKNIRSPKVQNLVQPKFEQLITAITSNDKDTINKLTDHMSLRELEKLDKDGRSIIHHAVICYDVYGDIQTVQSIYNLYPPSPKKLPPRLSLALKVVDHYGYSPINYATMIGDSDLISLLYNGYIKVSHSPHAPRCNDSNSSTSLNQNGVKPSQSCSTDLGKNHIEYNEHAKISTVISDSSMEGIFFLEEASQPSQESPPIMGNHYEYQPSLS